MTPTMNEKLSTLWKQANECFRKEDWDGIIAACTKILAITPDDATAYNLRGAAYGKKGDFDHAIEDFDKAIEYKPKFADAYDNRGLAYDKKGDVDRAIEDFYKAIEYKSDYARAYNNRGAAYSKKRYFDRAIKDLDKAIEYEPDLANAYNNRGLAYGEKGDFDRAIKDYDKAIEYKSDYANAYNNRGLAYHKKGDVERAIKDLDKAIEYESDYAIAYNNRGLAYHKKGDVDSAIKNYDKAIEYEPDYAIAYNNRGLAYHKKGDVDSAIKNYDKAIECKPDYADVYCHRGLAYHKKGDVERAIKNHNKAIEYEPDYAGAYGGRGIVYYEKEEFDHAIKDFSAAYDKGLKNLIILYLAYKINTIQPGNITIFKSFMDIWLTIRQIKKILNKPFDSVSSDPDKELKYKRVIHYCPLKTLKNMINGKSFHFYNVAYMNDPEEGEALFNIMSKDPNIRKYFYKDDATTYCYRPYYIGSFIAGKDSEDQISFWRIYGKNNGIDAAGCSLIFDRKQFSSTLKEGIAGMTSQDDSDGSAMPCLYRVFYEYPKTTEEDKSGNEQIIKELKVLHKQLKKLKTKIKKEKCKKSKQEIKSLACALIDSIRYLFKSKHYEHEHEVRVVEFRAEEAIKEEDTGINAPKFYIESYKNFCFSEVILGPKTLNAVALGVWVSKNRPEVKVRQSAVPYR